MSQDRILVGVIGAARGVRGEVRVRSFTGDPTAIGRYHPLLTEDGRVLVLAGVRPFNADLVTARIKGVESREAAAALNGVRLFTDRAALPAAADDEIYHVDLIGLEAIDESGGVVGTVSAVLNYGAGDILEVTSAGRPALLVPFTRAFVPVVDLEARRVLIAAGALAEDVP